MHVAVELWHNVPPFIAAGTGAQVAFGLAGCSPTQTPDTGCGDQGCFNTIEDAVYDTGEVGKWSRPIAWPAITPFAARRCW